MNDDEIQPECFLKARNMIAFKRKNNASNLVSTCTGYKVKIFFLLGKNLNRKHLSVTAGILIAAGFPSPLQ